MPEQNRQKKAIEEAIWLYREFGSSVKEPEWSVPQLLAKVRELEEEVEQLRVQLAGCSVAALGGKDDLQPGDYGWSASYSDVVVLRKRMEELEKENRQLKVEKEMRGQGLPVSVREVRDVDYDFLVSLEKENRRLFNKVRDLEAENARLRVVAEPLETQDKEMLLKKVRELKQMDGESCAVGEVIERLLAALEEMMNNAKADSE